MSPGAWWPLPRQLQMGMKVGWRELGDWVRGGGNADERDEDGDGDGGVPSVHYIPDSSLITPAELLRPPHSPLPPLSSTYETHSPRWWQPVPVAPFPPPPPATLAPPLNSNFLLCSTPGESPFFVSTSLSLSLYLCSFPFPFCVLPPH